VRETAREGKRGEGDGEVAREDAKE